MLRLLSLLVLLSACSHSPSPRVPASENEAMPAQIIDAHVHLETVWKSGSVDEFTANKVAAV